MQLYLNLRTEVFLLNVGLLAHAEQVERDLAPVLALMDGPGISHRLAALRACVWSDAQLRLAAHSRISGSPSPVISQRPVAVRPPVGAQHVQHAAAASATQKQVHATVPKPLLSRVPYYQQAVAIMDIKQERGQRGHSSNVRGEEMQLQRLRVPMEAPAEPPSAEASAEAHADADASEADLSHTFQQGCRLPRAPASSHTSHEQSQCMSMQEGQLRRSQRLQEVAERAVMSIESYMGEKQMPTKRLSLTQQLQAEVRRTSAIGRAAKRAR